MKMNFYVLSVFAVLILIFLFLNKKDHPNQRFFDFSTVSEISDLKCNDCNLILIMLHGLRQDRLSSFGYFRQTSPNMDKAINDGLTFDSLISTSSNFISNQNKILSYGSWNLADKLKSRGYKTAAFFDGQDVYRRLYSLPFDYFDNNKVPSIREKSTNVSKFIISNKNNKFFLLLASLEIHHPYRYPVSYYKKIFDPNYFGTADQVSLKPHWRRLDNGSYVGELMNSEIENDSGDIHHGHGRTNRNFYTLDLTERDVESIMARYDASIYYLDDFVGNVLRELESNNLGSRTIVAITTDVGLQRLERGYVTHEGPHDTEIKLPFFIYKPGLKIGKKTSIQIVHEDIAPVLMQILGFDVNGTDRNLLNLASGEINSNSRQFVIGRSHQIFIPSTDFQKCDYIRSNKWKLIDCDGELELYDLIRDPYETLNLMETNKEIAKGLYSKLNEGIANIDYPGDKEFFIVVKNRQPNFVDNFLNRLRVNKGDIVKLTIDTDMVYEFSLNEYGIHEVIFPGDFKTITFVADKVGTFNFTWHNSVVGTLTVD